MRIVDDFLNRITMYRLVMYYLMLLIAAAFVLAFFSVFSFSPWMLLFSFALITAVCWLSNEALARFFSVTPNTESVYITAFILTLIMTPVAIGNFEGAALLALASLIAMASKYVLAIGRKHIFNPAALGVAATGVLFGAYASWWVGGNISLSWLVLIGGLLVVRKIRRFDLFWSFCIVASVGIAIDFLPQSPAVSIEQTFIHSSLLFLATIMLTEPSTTPPTRLHRLVYGGIVGLFFIPGLHIGSIYSSPEIALLIGNLYSFAVSPKKRHALKLKEHVALGGGLHDFVFSAEKPLAFTPGQYLEWTLGHAKPDLRGNRRYFTVASSPTEQDVRLGIKIYEPSSTFKKALLELKPGDTIHAGQLAGDFTLPKDKSAKLAFIAGGIGITPFRSMVRYLVDHHERRDVVLLYSAKTADEIAYKDVFDDAAQIGLKSVYAVSDGSSAPAGFHLGTLDKKLLMREIPDYKERMYYISGPRSMVVAFKRTLHEMGVPRWRIRTDFFPGYA